MPQWRPGGICITCLDTIQGKYIPDMAKMNHVELYDHDVMSNGLVNENVYIALGEMVKERAKQSIDPDWTEADLCLEFFPRF